MPSNSILDLHLSIARKLGARREPVLHGTASHETPTRLEEEIGENESGCEATPISPKKKKHDK